MEQKVINIFVYIILFFIVLYLISFVYHRVLRKLVNVIKGKLKEVGNQENGVEKREESDKG